MRKPSPEELPPYFDELISVEQLHLDPLNPREEIPTDSLVESIRKIGFQRPLIVRPNPNSDSYLVTDGWERVQAGFKAGFSHIPCDIYQDSLDAMKHGRAHSIVKEWTWYENFIHIIYYYNECGKRGMDIKEAIDRTVDDNDVSDETVRRYLRMWELPTSVKWLLKEPRKRSDEEWAVLTKYNGNIKRHTDPISVMVVNDLAKYGAHLPEDRLLGIATNVLDQTASKARKIIREACKESKSDMPIRDIINETITGHAHPEVFNLPSSIILPPEDKKLILAYMAERRLYLNDLIRQLLGEFAWSLREAREGYYDDDKEDGDIITTSKKIIH